MISEPLNPAALGSTGGLFGPTRVGSVGNFIGTDSAPAAQGTGSVSSSFFAATQRAFSAVSNAILDPLQPVRDAAAHAVDASAAAVDAGAASVKAAGSGIYDGFKWAIIIAGGLLALYALSMLMAIMPRRS